MVMGNFECSLEKRLYSSLCVSSSLYLCVWDGSGGGDGWAMGVGWFSIHGWSKIENSQSSFGRQG